MWFKLDVPIKVSGFELINHVVWKQKRFYKIYGPNRARLLNRTQGLFLEF